MALDSRAKKAKKLLQDGAAKAAAHLATTEQGVNRSTATRAAYKAKADAADRALEVLSARS